MIEIKIKIDDSGNIDCETEFYPGAKNFDLLKGIYGLVCQASDKLNCNPNKVLFALLAIDAEIKKNPPLFKQDKTRIVIPKPPVKPSCGSATD